MREIDFSKNIWILAFIALTFIFGVVARLEWVSYASGNDSMVYNGEVMINTNDGYYFAEGARDIIAGFHQENDLSPVENSMSKTTAFLYKILPGVSFESVILYMSVFFSSLLVVPIMLIAREFRATEVGIIAGLVGVIGNSYYNRTMAGYYDTDMLNIVLPLFVLWGMINFLNKNKITPITQ